VTLKEQSEALVLLEAWFHRAWPDRDILPPDDRALFDRTLIYLTLPVPRPPRPPETP
jgi:hypothetical protein